jgi:ABC-type multidrug transport system ATPase subunit
MRCPELLILDEPASGLDPLRQDEFRPLVRKTTTDGRLAGIVVSSVR